jgi:hypothetical protein
MPSLTLTAVYEKNKGLIFSPEELFNIYFYGINIQSKDCTELSDETIKFYLRTAQGEIEKSLGIRLFTELISENYDYFRDDYENNFPFIRTSLPVRDTKTLIGRLNGVEQIRYPEQWLAEKFYRSGLPYRQFGVVPNGSVINADADVILTGVSSYYGLRSYPQIPNYWFVQFITGFEPGKVPEELMNIIGMWAAIPILAIAGDLILGAGIASQSLSIDGLSQSISSTSSATNAGYGARIVEYRKTVKESLSRWKRAYSGVRFASL